jgi:type IV secretory pathway VirB4 component
MGNYFQIGERFGQAMYLDNVANWMNSNFLADFCNLNFESVVTMHIEPIPQEDALKKIKEQSVNITAAIMDKQKGAIREGYSPEFLPAHLKNANEQIDNLQEDLTNRDQKMFYMSLCLMHFADTKEELETNKKVIKNTAAKYMSTIQPLMMQQERGFATALPLGLDKIFAKRPLTTESLGVFIPFDEAVSFEEGGFYYGVNPVNKSLIIHNRLNGMNYNGLVLGASGSGKSFASKREMISAILSTDADIFIIDPDGEYSPLAEAFGGTVVNIAPGNQVHINPLDLDTDTTFDSDLNPMAMKTDFTCGILETMLGNGARLTPTQRSIMDRCIQQIYRPYLEHLQELPPDASGKRRTIDREQCPTFQQLFDALLSQPQPEAQNLALVMETYTTGTFDTFAHRTNQDLNSRLIVYNIKNVGTNLKELALKVCTNDVWNRMVENKRKNKWTWFYIDEFHLLLSNPSTSEFLKSIWKRARKFQGVPTGITQNVEDLLNSPDARTIINNTSFTYLLNQSEMDRRMLTELLKLTENDMEYITHVDPGHGLIVNNGRALPFVDEFPKDTKLYKIMSTKAGES